MAHGDDRLAALVRKARAETAIDALDAEGVYDDGRHVCEHDAARVAVPVTEPPRETPVDDLVAGAGDRRVRTLADRLRARGWSAEAVDAAPSSWGVVGDVALVDLSALDRERWEDVADALATHTGVATVCHRRGVAGPHREPDLAVVHGERTRTVHVEDGTAYAVDLADVMFSPGNQAERRRMGRVVASGERVLDMFAGVGYFALPMARAGADVVAVERNTTTYGFLVENARRNDVTDRLTAVRGDCRAVVAGARGVRGGGPLAGEAVDRVVLGHFGARDALPVAVRSLAGGGRLHLHDVAPAGDATEDREPPEAAVRSAAAGTDRAVRTCERRVVKSYSEGLDHVVVDATVG
ncbi:MAG: class I SAM-dependent methyltransferase family protein [Halobacteriaceae archaeon]